MSSPLTEYISSLYAEFHRPNLFSVSFDPPFSTFNEIDYSSILVRTAQMPGLTTNVLTNIYNNKKQNFAVSVDLDPITMDIFCDTKNDAHSFIMEWAREAIQPDTRIMNYKENYAGTIEIDMHTRPLIALGLSSVNATLTNAFPINVSPVELSHDSVDVIAQFSVTWIFDEITYSFSGGLLDTLLSVGVGGLTSSPGFISLL